MKPRNVLHLYRVRLRARLLQECFAVVGIAAGVALLFASQVATSSLSSSVAQLSQGIIGNATLQLLARDPQGLEAGMLARVRAIGGVRAAAPLLEASTQASGPRGSESVELVGVDSSLTALGGSLVRHASPSSFAGVEVVALPAPLAHTLGVSRFGDEITFRLNGRVAEAGLYEQLHASQIGPLTSSPIAVAPLAASQEMSGLAGRVSRILVEPAPGRERAVRAALIGLAAGAHLNVEPASYDETLFARASAATNQSTQLFALISALVGFLFAFNAMLLTVPQRRRLIADLRRDGYPPASVIVVLLFDAIVLGVLACVLGLVLGEELSIHLFHSNPGYLSSAFAVGSERVVSAQSVLVAVGGGMLAAIVAVLSPLREILSRRPPTVTAPGDLTAGDGGSGGVGLVKLALGGVACLAGATAILLAAPHLAILGMVLLVAALLLLLALPLVATLALVRALAPRIVSAVPHVAVMELRAGRTRALAISATGAIAVFGSVAIQAAHGDLLHGLENAAHDMNAFTDVWVSPAGSYNLLQTAPFTPTDQDKLARLPGVRAVRLYRGGLLDWRDRRIWVIAPPRASSPLLPASQIVEGNVRSGDRAGARRRLGGADAGDRRRTPPAHRLLLHAALASADAHARRRALDEHRLGARRDRDERERLRPRVGQSGRERLQRPARSGRLARPGPPRDRTRAGSAHGVGGGNGRPARRPPEHAQPPGPHAPDADRDADPDRRDPGDGGGDGEHGVAAPPAPGQAQARGLSRGRAVAHDPAGERAARRRRLRQRRGIRAVRSAAAGSGAGERDRVSRRLLVRRARGASRALRS